MSDRVVEVVLSGERLDSGQIAALTRRVRSLGGDTGALVLRSAGADFCLGRAAAPGPAPSTPDEVQARVLDPILDLYAAITEAPWPVVAAVHGRALGLGFALAACCDLVLVTEESTFALPEIDAGFAPLLALSQLVHVLPRQLAFRLAATATEISGRRLVEVGLAADVVDAAELPAHAREIADSLARRAPVPEVKAFLAQRTAVARQTDAAYAADRLGSALSSS